MPQGFAFVWSTGITQNYKLERVKFPLSHHSIFKDVFKVFQYVIQLVNEV